jgi:hypothetical protein
MAYHSILILAGVLYLALGHPNHASPLELTDDNFEKLTKAGTGRMKSDWLVLVSDETEESDRLIGIWKELAILHSHSKKPVRVG